MNVHLLVTLMHMVDISVAVKEYGLENVKNHIVKLVISMIKLQINVKEINVFHKIHYQFPNYMKKLNQNI